MQDPEELLIAARDLYEGTHGLSMADVTDMTGIPRRTLSMRARDEDWTKKRETKSGKPTQEAVEAAAFFRERHQQNQLVTEEVNDSTSVLADPLPAEREQLLKRHREEWVAPRAMVGEAVRLRVTDPFKAMERAKLAKIAAETLKIVQDGERKSHGLDVGDIPQGHVVVIERA